MSMRGLLVVLVAGCGRLGFDAGLPDDAGDAGTAAEMFPVIYTLDEVGPGGRVASSWPAFDGFCQASVCPTMQPGIRGGALQFSGAQGIYLPAPSLVGSSAYTVTAWIAPSVIGVTPRTVVAKPYSSASRWNSFALLLETNGLLQFELAVGGNPDYLGATRPVTTTAWHHVAASWDGVNRSLFLDGNLEATDAPMVDREVAYPMFIGADIDVDTIHAPFAGLIDDVRFYDRALDAAEIAALATP